MGVDAERSGGLGLQLLLDRQYGLARGQAGAVADPEYMRVDRERFGAKGTVHHDIGGLATDPGQLDQLVAIRRNFAAKIGDLC